jgi:hypothetical protein
MGYRRYGCGRLRRLEIVFKKYRVNKRRREAVRAMHHKDSLAFPAHILNAESEYGEGLLPHLQKEYGELGVDMAT